MEVSEEGTSVEVSLNNDNDNKEPETTLSITGGGLAATSRTDEATAPETAPNVEPNAQNDQEQPPVYGELEYAMKSFHAIVQPVFLTMVLSALSVVFIQTPESLEANTEALSGTYQIYRSSEGASNGQELGQSLVNALVIVCAICVATFVIVILYKYRCMKCLLGYMIAASLLLLSTLSAVVFQVAVDRYKLNIDKLSFYATVYNISVVGTASIFHPTGFPTYIAQASLIWTSVLVAWQFSHFEDWTAWALLVMLALYDLYAVLTPCGPLKALVGLMSASDAPAMPGLLYEANLQGRKKTPTSDTEGSSSAASQTPAGTTEEGPVTAEEGTTSAGQETAVDVDASERSVEPVAREQPKATDDPPSSEEQRRDTPSTRPLHTSTPSLQGETDPSESSANMTTDPLASPDPSNSNLCHIPFALAKVYRLPLSDNEGRPLSLSEQPVWMQPADSDDPPAPVEYTAQELLQIVPVLFPPRGGRIRPRDDNNDDDTIPVRYTVTDGKGNFKRTLFVNEQGKVFEERTPDASDQNGPRFKGRHSIRLGLGDFIFYSILVAKAALYSWASFWISIVVIVSGLGSTLALLALYKKALPALPISIFGGVIFYLLTRYLMQDWFEEISILAVYV